ncbi:MAG: T9SS type A sorting domain-containing protein [Melioribacteraceae bacterium]|nr:T9SS type A sorting domain-containing protein [Melioribacteraceae bacterium]
MGNGLKGKKNLDLTSFSPMFRYNYDYIVEGSNKDEWYNNLNGKLTRFDSYPIDPLTGLATKFPLAGDPNTQTGWYEGEGWPDGPAPYDRRFMINTGNITFNYGDTLDIAYAIIISDGNDRLNSLKLLKEKTQHIRDFYFDTITKVNYNEEMSPTFSLSQNYPNPFNPTTSIEYQVSSIEKVSLKVYDILGREIKTLVNEVKSPGSYDVQFDASQLASGVYFYRLTAGDFVQTKKMILLR